MVKPAKYEIVITKRVGIRSEISNFSREDAEALAGIVAKALFGWLSQSDYGVWIKEIEEIA